MKVSMWRNLMKTTEISEAFDRGVKSTLERLGDGAMLLRKQEIVAANHDQIEQELRKWLHSDTHGLRAPGVKDNLFRLSDYLSGRLPVPPESTLLFLHAYIFALESANYALREQLKKQQLTKRPCPPVKPKRPPVKLGS
jgi:hypothetical protein